MGDIWNLSAFHKPSSSNGRNNQPAKQTTKRWGSSINQSNDQTSNQPLSQSSIFKRRLDPLINPVLTFNPEPQIMATMLYPALKQITYLCTRCNGRSVNQSNSQTNNQSIGQSNGVSPSDLLKVLKHMTEIDQSINQMIDDQTITRDQTIGYMCQLNDQMESFIDQSIAQGISQLTDDIRRTMITKLESINQLIDQKLDDIEADNLSINQLLSEKEQEHLELESINQSNIQTIEEQKQLIEELQSSNETLSHSMDESKQLNRELMIEVKELRLKILMNDQATRQANSHSGRQSSGHSSSQSSTKSNKSTSQSIAQSDNQSTSQSVTQSNKPSNAQPKPKRASRSQSRARTPRPPKPTDDEPDHDPSVNQTDNLVVETSSDQRQQQTSSRSRSRARTPGPPKSVDVDSSINQLVNQSVDCLNTPTKGQSKRSEIEMLQPHNQSIASIPLSGITAARKRRTRSQSRVREPINRSINLPTSQALRRGSSAAEPTNVRDVDQSMGQLNQQLNDESMMLDDLPPLEKASAIQSSNRSNSQTTIQPAPKPATRSPSPDKPPVRQRASRGRSRAPTRITRSSGSPNNQKYPPSRLSPVTDRDVEPIEVSTDQAVGELNDVSINQSTNQTNDVSEDQSGSQTTERSGSTRGQRKSESLRTRAQRSLSVSAQTSSNQSIDQSDSQPKDTTAEQPTDDSNQPDKQLDVSTLRPAMSIADSKDESTAEAIRPVTPKRKRQSGAPRGRPRKKNKPEPAQIEEGSTDAQMNNGADSTDDHVMESINQPVNQPINQTEQQRTEDVPANSTMSQSASRSQSNNRLINETSQMSSRSGNQAISQSSSHSLAEPITFNPLAFSTMMSATIDQSTTPSIEQTIDQSVDREDVLEESVFGANPLKKRRAAVKKGQLLVVYGKRDTKTPCAFDL